jgi:hypothetical protein
VDWAQFQKKLLDLYTISERIAGEHEWCCEWLNTFTRLSPWFEVFHDQDSEYCSTVNYEGYCGINILTAPANTAESPLDPSWFTAGGWEKHSPSLIYDAELARIRGRIIFLAGTNISEEEAGEVLTELGLPGFTRDDAIPLLDEDE